MTAVMEKKIESPTLKSIVEGLYTKHDDGKRYWGELPVIRHEVFVKPSKQNVVKVYIDRKSWNENLISSTTRWVKTTVLSRGFGVPFQIHYILMTVVQYPDPNCDPL